MAGVRACVNAALAQSAERLTRNEKVEGSIPSGGSNTSLILLGSGQERKLLWFVQPLGSVPIPLRIPRTG